MGPWGAPACDHPPAGGAAAGEEGSSHVDEAGAAKEADPSDKPSSQV